MKDQYRKNLEEFMKLLKERVECLTGGEAFAVFVENEQRCGYMQAIDEYECNKHAIVTVTLDGAELFCLPCWGIEFKYDYETKYWSVSGPKETLHEFIDTEKWVKVQ